MSSCAVEQLAPLVVFSHGKESGQNGRKIQALGAFAQSEGAQTLSVNYREHPAGIHHDHDAPDEANRRVEQLLATPMPPHKRLILVGSSMGGYISAVAASRMLVDGLFLLVPALAVPGYAQAPPKASAPDATIVHGWRDEIIPWEHCARWASEARCALHLIDVDHRLDSALPAIEPLFRQFLKGLNP
jgi:alpha-beta hydrolase superfamily lysophospholipase